MKVNEQQIVSALKNSFTDDTNLITELIQNSRRAGATFTSIVLRTYPDNTADFIVHDDGCGISDFQKLFTVAESGWSQEVIESDNPFGMGFMLAVYMCESLEVHSNGKYVEATKQELLSFSDIEVKDSTEFVNSPGTVVILRGVSSYKFTNFSTVESFLRRKLLAFPIRVLCSQFSTSSMPLSMMLSTALAEPDLEVLRPLADANVLATEYDAFPSIDGITYLSKKGSYYATTHSRMVIFQGALIGSMGPMSYHSMGTSVAEVMPVVFVANSTRFVARVPDRDVFVNASDAKALIETNYRNAVLSRATALKAKLLQDISDGVTDVTPEEEHLWSIIRPLSGISPLFYNDIPRIPTVALHTFGEAMGMNSSTNVEYLERTTLLTTEAHNDLMTRTGGATHILRGSDIPDGMVLLSSASTWDPEMSSYISHKVSSVGQIDMRDSQQLLVPYLNGLDLFPAVLPNLVSSHWACAVCLNVREFLCEGLHIEEVTKDVDGLPFIKGTDAITDDVSMYHSCTITGALGSCSVTDQVVFGHVLHNDESLSLELLLPLGRCRDSRWSVAEEAVNVAYSMDSLGLDDKYTTIESSVKQLDTWIYDYFTQNNKEKILKDILLGSTRLNSVSGVYTVTITGDVVKVEAVNQ